MHDIWIGTLTLLILYICLAVGVSFICSISEAVLLSVRPSYIAALKQRGSKRATILKDLTDNLDRPLAAILTLNTVAHTVGAAGVGAEAARVFGDNALGITSALLTLAILVLSEIIPKTIGATYWQQLAPAFGTLIHVLTRVLLPFVWMSEKITSLLSRSGTSTHTFSRDEIEAIAEISVHEGLLETKELTIVRNLMRLTQLSVRDIMTPRSVIFSLPETMKVDEFFSEHAEKPFSRIPLYGSDFDDVGYYALKTDLLAAQADDAFSATLVEFKRDLPVIPDILSASDTFDRLIHEKSHIALVVDEYGSAQGIVTLEDVLETLIGLEITDEVDRVEDMQALARERWRTRMEAIGVDPDSIDKTR